MNSETFPLPTSYNLYKTLTLDEDLANTFRLASLIRSGSLGSTNLTVSRVPLIRDDADKSSCPVQFKLKQSNISLDITKHIRNFMNAVTFDWEVPKAIHKELKVGDDVIRKGFRVGSLIKSGSMGDWHLIVTDKKPCLPLNNQSLDYQ